MRKIRTSAFTLVELLVVIGVIALLIGILMPALARARVASQRTACLAHLHDIGSLFQMYLNDSKGRVPRVNPIPSMQPPLNSFPSLVEVFAPYTKGATKGWQCPADRITNPAPAGVPVGFETYFQRDQSSYEYNDFVNAFGGGVDMWVDLVHRAKETFNLPQDRFRIFNDQEPFHGKAGKKGAMNYLFADMHAGDWDAPAPPQNPTP
jgi:type II secretory pathway pseudopilin PulG